MAEVFGVITGAISVGSLAIQIIDSIHKLRSFCAAVRDAPACISDVLEELEILSDTLLHICQDDEFNQAAADSGLQRSLTYCNRVADELHSIMRDFTRCFNIGTKAKMTWSKVKFALKKNDIRDLLGRLERAKSILSIAIQCSTA